MARRKINPILLLSQPIDRTFITALRNKHVTRFGNPASPEGATYGVSDQEGLLQAAIDLEYLRLVTDGLRAVPVPLEERIRDRVFREHALLLHRLRCLAVPKALAAMLEIPRKADLEKFCARLSFSEFELFLLILNSGSLGWRHKAKFREYVPDHLEINTSDRRNLHAGNLVPFSRKMDSLMEQRRRIHVHVFHRAKQWHCFYFSHDDVLDGSNAHWKHGPHVHYVSHLWPKYGRQQVWRLFDTRRTAVSGALHIRFRPFEYPPTHRRQPVPFSEFGYQPMLSAINSTLPSRPNYMPIGTAELATRGFWSFEISTPR